MTSPAVGAGPRERAGTRQEVGPRPVGEVLCGVVTVGLGIFTLVGAMGIIEPGSANTMGPRAFPYAVGGLLALAGGAVLVDLARGRRAEEEGGEDVDTAGAGTDWRTVAMTVGSFLSVVVLIRPAGWIVAATVLFAGTSAALGARPLWRPVLVGFALATVVQVVFTRLLGVYLPPGVFAGVPGLDG